ncbi:unnamed protein product [Anisakis simplex]|uniref:Cat eye syndrome critical region protein 5 (inferred by orthology to a human protein) n=1 Tax=Anisakis simplex TaxID=6269 RepID=A0A0M3K875_ANISI|nr:unnamed protein product [Anisakis simplex]
MAHSPLRMFSDYHERPVLACGQGPTRDIAVKLGFRDVTTVDDLRTLLPELDVVDVRRRRIQPHKLLDHGFYPLESILLLGEPLNWESALQLIIDVLTTNGLKEFKSNKVSYPHIPVFASNLDLFWMGDSAVPIPRFGHGIFLTCLEQLYKKMTGQEIRYKAITGKPTEVTYLYASELIEEQAEKMNLPPPRKVFVLGDNKETDILGANLFEHHLQTGDKGRFDKCDLTDLRKNFNAFNKYVCLILFPIYSQAHSFPCYTHLSS